MEDAIRSAYEAPAVVESFDALEVIGAAECSGLGCGSNRSFISVLR